MTAIGTWELLILLLFGGFLPVPLGVPPLDEDPAIIDAAPAETLLLAEWFGIGDADPRSANLTERLAAEPEVRHFLDAIERAILARLQTAGGERSRMVSQAVGFGKLLFSRPGCIFVSGLTPGPELRIQGGILVNFGASAPEAGRYLREFEAFITRGLSRGEDPSPPKTLEVDGITFRVLPLPQDAPQVAWGFSGGYLILAVGEGMPRMIAQGLKEGGGLGSQPEFRDLREKARVERPCFRSYLDLPRIIQLILPMAGRQGAVALDALGVGGLGKVVSETGLDGGGVASRGFVATRGIPAGILRLFEGKPLTDGEISIIPADATFAAGFRFNPEAIFNEFVAFLGRVDPRARERFLEAELGRVEEALGVRLVEDLLRPLGDAWCLWSSPGEGGLIVTGLTLAIPVKDRERFSRTLEKIEASLPEKLGIGPGRGGARDRRGAFIRSVPGQERNIRFLDLPGVMMPVAPSWCLTDRHLLVSLYPQMLKAALRRGASMEGSIARHPALSGERDFISFSLVDVPAAFRTLYPALHPLAQLGCSQLQREGIAIDISALPSTAAILPHLRPEFSTVESIPGGIRFTRRGTALGIDPLTVTLLPALAGLVSYRRMAVVSRDRAQEAQGKAQMTQIQQVLKVYYMETGRYPDSLEDLLETGEGQGPFLKSLPKDPSGRPYLYYGPVGDDRIMLATPTPQRGRRLVIFGDGRMESIPEAAFQKLTREKRARR